MQTPYCVIDATTLVENIHGIKKWVYNGQIRLVVPLSTLERVEQLYQKSIEQKPKAQEPARPKSSGKTARKEHPTFDINPRLTKAFLAWLQREKDYWDPELPCAVEFQKANEVYTPWKLAEEQEDKRDGSPEKGPTTFAEAVAKSNLAKQVSRSNEVAQGPAKPKLVARAPGSDRSPWRIGRKVPQIPLREVPAEVRPALSYVLWRLHESDKGRADASSLIVLSDDRRTYIAGQKLDTVVRKMEEIRHTVAAQIVETDRNALGDLEREFGIKEPCLKTLQNGSVHGNGKTITHSNGIQTQPVNGESASNGDSKAVEILNQPSDGKGEEKSDRKENSVNDHFRNYLDGCTVVERPLSDFQFAPQHAENEIESRDLTKQSYPSVIDIAEKNTTLQDGLIESAGPVSNEFVSEKISNITAWIKNLAPKLGSSPEPNLNSQEATESPIKKETVSQQPQARTIHQPMVLQRAAELSAPSPHRIPNASPAPPRPVEEPEDSDEEVVVFNPKAKRLSAQQKSPQQSPKQDVTPNASQSPKPSAAQIQKQNVQQSPKKATRVPQPQTKTPPVAPAIIDPDAFGRSFATNPRANVHNNHPNSRYSPRGSPRRAVRTPEPELDYVLKSGNTRASIRGKGKLWVP